MLYKHFLAYYYRQDLNIHSELVVFFNALHRSAGYSQTWKKGRKGWREKGREGWREERREEERMVGGEKGREGERKRKRKCK